jgi:hypothetical protein
MSSEQKVDVTLQVWKCKNGHGLGIVRQTGNKAAQLMLYRNAIDVESQNPVEVDVIAVIESAVDIRCGICGEMRTWAPNQAAFERLMAHYKKSSHADTGKTSSAGLQRTQRKSENSIQIVN